MPNLERNYKGKVIATTIFWTSIMASVIFAGLLIHQALAMKTSGQANAVVNFGPFQLYQLSKVPQTDGSFLVTMGVLSGLIAYLAFWALVTTLLIYVRLAKMPKRRT